MYKQFLCSQLSEEQKVPQEQIWMQLHEILDEMGQTQTMPVVRWFGFALSKIMKRIYKGVYVNEESIERVSTSIESYYKDCVIKP
jgi:glycerol-3-phosphate O-acyltransferase